jgi:hypothetical protein
MRILLVSGLMALVAPAFAAEPMTQTTREDRMSAAYTDYQSGKTSMSASEGKPKATHKTTHKAAK